MRKAFGTGFKIHRFSHQLKRTNPLGTIISRLHSIFFPLVRLFVSERYGLCLLMSPLASIRFTFIFHPLEMHSIKVATDKKISEGDRF